METWLYTREVQERNEQWDLPSQTWLQTADGTGIQMTSSGMGGPPGGPAAIAALDQGLGRLGDARCPRPPPAGSLLCIY